MCSKWVDLVELISSQDVDIVDDMGENISETFLTALADYKKSAPLDRSGEIGKSIKNFL